MPGTLQHNGVVERWNHTLMNMVRSMLNYSIVHLSLWMHALMTDAYMLNRVPKNPYEL